MFTGIIREMGRVVSLERKASGAVLVVEGEESSREAIIGASVAINGCCLTVTDIKGRSMKFDLSDETLRSTNLGAFKPGEKVNLEPALKAVDPLGGHLVTGHVDAVGRIKSKRQTGESYNIEIEAPGEVLRYLVDKGSVAVDGISLTVVQALQKSFTVVIIPHTADVTTIGFKEAGDAVNLEADIIGKYVARFLEKAQAGGHGGTLMKSLMDAGYIRE
jgi:riboflavin synthase